MFKIQDLSLLERAQVAPRDKYINCRECQYKKICGGFYIYSDSRWCDGECENCRVLCCQLEESYKIAADLNGLKWDDVKWDKWDFRPPDFLWTVGGKVGNINEPVYLIPVDSLINKVNGTWAGTINLRQRFAIPESSKIGITFAFKDWLLDFLLLDEDMTHKQLAKYDVDFILPIDYSVWYNYPRMDQLIQMRRKMLSMKRLQDMGIKSIPDITLDTKQDALRWAEWLNKNECNICFYCMQRVKVRNSKRWNKGMKYIKLLIELCPDLHFLFAGVNTSNMKKVHSLVGDKFSVISSSAWVFAELRMDILTREKLRDLNYSTINTFKRNIKKLKDFRKITCNG